MLTRRDGAVARLLRQARFPDLKTLDQLDWEALRGVERPQLAQLATCEYIERAEDVVIAGPIGTGKTHLAIALGVEATRHHHRVAFIRAADLVRELLEARDELTLSRLHQRYLRVALLIVDELGFVPFERTGGELLFNLLADRYERALLACAAGADVGAVRRLPAEGCQPLQRGVLDISFGERGHREALFEEAISTVRGSKSDLTHSKDSS